MGNKQTMTKSRDVEESIPPRKHKVLLLGASHTGKSTLFKQLVSPIADLYEAPHIRVAVIRSCMNLLVALANEIKENNLLPNIDSLIQSLDQILSNTDYDDYKISPDEAIEVSNAWKDHMAVHYNKFKNMGSVRIYSEMKKYMKHFVELCDGSLPITREMMSSVYIQTSGISEGDLNLNMNEKASVVDVGGRRTERRKWIHCFDETSVVIFLVSLTEFCETIVEDTATCSMTESLQLFSTVANSAWFAKQPFIILFTKRDLLADRLRQYPISCFEDIPDILKNVSQLELISSESEGNYVSNNAEGCISFEQLQSIPRDVLDHILTYYSASQLCMLSLVNRFFYDVTGSDQVWKQLIVQNSGHTLKHETVVAVYKDKYLSKNEISGDIHTKPYKFYYSIGSLVTDEAVKYFTNKFLSEKKDRVSSYALNLKKEKSVRKVVQMITEALDAQCKDEIPDNK